MDSRGRGATQVFPESRVPRGTQDQPALLYQAQRDPHQESVDPQVALDSWDPQDLRAIRDYQGHQE